MGKTKKKKKRTSGLAEKVTKNRQKYSTAKSHINVTNNPFETKTNREKHNVFGRKLETGRPGLARSRAHDKRKNTLLKEYKQKYKSNRFIDKRIGEKDAEMDMEEKMMQRYAIEKKNKHVSANKYNLESEELTHYGQSLSEIEKFDSPVNSDIEDDDAHDKDLGKKLSKEMFGGFVDKKDEKTPWKERMMDLIANAKQEKYNRLNEIDQVKDMTEQVDEQWRYLVSVMATAKRNNQIAGENEGPDDYDISVNTMKFDITAMASDRLKTEEEVAKDELDKLTQLEEDRMKRMSGVLDSDVPEKTRVSEFRSADDLDVGWRVKGYKPFGTVSFDTSDQESHDETDDDEDGDERDGGDEGDDNEKDVSNGDDEKVADENEESSDEEMQGMFEDSESGSGSEDDNMGIEQSEDIKQKKGAPQSQSENPLLNKIAPIEDSDMESESESEDDTMEVEHLPKKGEQKSQIVASQKKIGKSKKTVEQKKTETKSILKNSPKIAEKKEIERSQKSVEVKYIKGDTKSILKKSSKVTLSMETSVKNNNEEKKETPKSILKKSSKVTSSAKTSVKNSKEQKKETPKSILKKSSKVTSSAETSVKNSKEQKKETPKSILKKSTSTVPKKIDFKVRKEMMDVARSELPYTFDMPETYDELYSLLEGYTSEIKIEIVTRLRKCHHISLSHQNRNKLERLFTLLVQYFCDMADENPPDYTTIDSLTPHLYHLCQLSPIACGNTMVGLIILRHEQFSDLAARKAGRGLYPMLDELLLLRLVPLLFPTSDFAHPVVMPALVYMLQILAQCPINTMKDVATGLFLCHLCLDYVSKSKRYIPEVVNYLVGCLFLAAHKTPNTIEPVIPPFKPVGKSINLLHINTDCSQSTIAMPVKLSDTLSPSVDNSSLETDTCRLQMINCCIDELSTISKLYTHLPSYREICAPLVSMASKLPMQKYPTSLQTKIKDMVTTIENNSNYQRKYLLQDKPKPKVLRMYECDFEDEPFDGRKRHKGRPEQKERQKLKYLHKREMKGAIRELRRDTQFMARYQLKDQLRSDFERKRKVKDIYNQLSMQEGDYNKMIREKKFGRPDL